MILVTLITRCKFTQKPRVANCVRVRTYACSAAHALVTCGWCVKLEVNSLKFDRRKQRCLPKEAMLITCWYLCFLVSWALWFAIRCHCLVSHLCDPFTRALPLLSFPVLSAFTLIPSTISHLWNQPCSARRCSWQYADAVLTLLRSFIKCDGSAHIYIHTNASSESDCCHQD